MSHITGGGYEENVPRMLPKSLGARLNRSAWAVPPIFEYIRRAGSIEEEEMYRVFKMGLGFMFAVAPANGDTVRRLVPEAVLVGEVIPVVAEQRLVWR
jgi:phosphoribosylaminoimidazole (AIR) synthetase